MKPDGADDAITRQAREREKRDSIPRYTIEQQSGTIYFRLIEDPNGAWVTFENHNALVTKLELRIEQAESALRAVQQQTREACAKAIPTSWLDPLLSGPDAILKPPYGCFEIERLLRAIKARVMRSEGRVVMRHRKHNQTGKWKRPTKKGKT